MVKRDEGVRGCVGLLAGGKKSKMRRSHRRDSCVGLLAEFSEFPSIHLLRHCLYLHTCSTIRVAGSKTVTFASKTHTKRVAFLKLVSTYVTFLNATLLHALLNLIGPMSTAW